MIKKLLVVSVSLASVAFGACAGEQDIAALQAKVDAKVQQIEDTGLLLSYNDIEQIIGDTVAREVATTDLTVAQAVEKYQLSSHIERYLKVKEVSRIVADDGSGNGQGNEEPPRP